jgi:hypothetical protein
MLNVFAARILRTLEADNPDLPWFDPGPAEEAYRAMDPRRLADEILRSASCLADTLDHITQQQWKRVARRDGTDPFTVKGLACYVLHEERHHRLVADGTLAVLAAGYRRGPAPTQPTGDPPSQTQL